MEFPRPKTGIKRRCALWPETISAIRTWLDQRPEPKDEAHAGLLLLKPGGTSWLSEDNPVTSETAKLLKSVDMARPGLNFYALRHTFETIGGESRDQVAV